MACKTVARAQLTAFGEIKLFDISSHSAESLWGETTAKHSDSYDTGAASARSTRELPHVKGSQERGQAGAAANAGAGPVIGGVIVNACVSLSASGYV